MAAESIKNKTQRCAEIIKLLESLYPDARCSLRFKKRDPLQLLVATILSAQCTDKRVNMVTPELFKKYPAASDYAAADLDQLEQMIRSTGFYRNKAKNIKGAAAKIVEDFDGEVPDTMAQLLKLPGVARKTANCVLSNAFGKHEGVVVDTHVGRLSRRLKLSKAADPKAVEKDLVKLVDQPKWGDFSHLLIYHGRARCTARKPDCENCELVAGDLCPSAGKADDIK